MPSFIFWPSSLAAPLKGAEIPNRISLSVIPRTGMLMELCSGGASRACCACTLLDCCAPDDPATPGVVSAGALLIAKRSDNLDAFSGGCVIHPSQIGFVMVPMIIFNDAQTTEIAIQLTNLSQK